MEWSIQATKCSLYKLYSPRGPSKQRIGIAIRWSRARFDILLVPMRHLCTRFRINGIKAMSHGILGGKRVIKFANTSNRGQVCLIESFRFEDNNEYEYQI